MSTAAEADLETVPQLQQEWYGVDGVGRQSEVGRKQDWSKVVSVADLCMLCVLRAPTS